jgi:signal transduction histidine kinase
LVQFHEASDAPAAALKVLRQLLQLKERILSQRVRNQAIIRSIDLDFAAQNELIGQLQLKNQVAELEAANLREAEERRRFQRNFLLVGILLLSGTLAVMLLLLRMLARSRKLLQQQQQDLAATNAELRRLMQEKDDVISIVAHDLRNPLGNILAAGAVLKDDLRELPIDNADDTTPEMLRSIIQSAELMEQIISELLDLERINQRTHEHRLASVPVTDVLKACTARMGSAAAAKRQVLEVRDAPVPLAAQGEANLLAQILDNLLSNAIKYSPLGGRILVQVEALSSHEVRISVDDNGPGIPAAQRDQLFTKFSRIGTRPTAEEPSTGLGLYIAQRMAEFMNGNLIYHDSPLGGSSFQLTLSRAAIGSDRIRPDNQ